MKKIVLTMITIGWMSMIFMFSSQDGTSSSEMSNSFLEKTLVKVYSTIHPDATWEELENMKNTWTYPIRKVAHFSLYFVLAILVYETLKAYQVRKNSFLYSLGICFLYACSDEVHQLFVANRSGQALDVLIDTLGSVSALISSQSIKYFKNKKKRRGYYSAHR